LSSCAGNGDAKWVDLKTEAPASTPTFRIVGTVHHLDVEGGVFVIRDEQGTQYNPLNLPPAFRVEGMKVEADACRRDDMMSIGMVGPLVELQRIRQQPGGDSGR
jgi:hypothetical protein